MVQSCRESKTGKEMVNLHKERLENFDKGLTFLQELNKEHFAVVGDHGQDKSEKETMASDVVTRLTLRTAVILEKYKGVVQGGKFDKNVLAQDINYFNKEFEKFRLLASELRKETKVFGQRYKKLGAIIDGYRKFRDDLLQVLKDVPQLFDKSQNFEAYKDKLLIEQKIEKKGRIKSKIVSKIKYILEHLGFKPEISFKRRVGRFTKKILNKRKEMRIQAKGRG